MNETQQAHLNSMREFLHTQVEALKARKEQLLADLATVNAELKSLNSAVKFRFKQEPELAEELERIKLLDDKVFDLTVERNSVQRKIKRAATVLRAFDEKRYQFVIGRYISAIDESRDAEVTVGEKKFRLWEPMLAMKAYLMETKQKVIT